MVFHKFKYAKLWELAYTYTQKMKNMLLYHLYIMDGQLSQSFSWDTKIKYITHIAINVILLIEYQYIHIMWLKILIR